MYKVWKRNAQYSSSRWSLSRICTRNEQENTELIFFRNFTLFLFPIWSFLDFYTIETMKTFLSIFPQYIDPSDAIVIGVSGWVDSMVLLDLILKSHPKKSLVVVHFDHMLRWEDSDRDWEFVRNFCQKNNLIFEFDRVDIGEIHRISGGSLEAIARAERYGFLEKEFTKVYSYQTVTVFFITLWD